MDRENRARGLVEDFRRGYLTRRGFLAKAAALGLTAAGAAGLLAAPTGQRSAGAQDSPEVTPQKWEKGKGWGWVWGDEDQLGNLNELGPDLTKKALSLVKEGRVYDLGLTYKRSSYKFAGHNPGEVISFRTPTGMLNQKDLDFVRSEDDNSLNTTFTSNALFISDNVATQIDSLGHIFEGDPPHAYNGFRYEDIQSDWGLLKMGAETIPPIVAPATMIDVAKSAGEDPLPESYAIGPDRLQKALDEQGVDIDPLDVVLVRTGTAGVWMEGNGVGANEEEMAKVDTAGLTVSGAKWLVEEKGALAVGTDTSGVEVLPPKEHLDDGTSFNPVHVYLLVRQGAHILEYQNQPGGAGQRRGVQVRVRAGGEQDRGHGRRHGAPPDRTGLSRRTEDAPPEQARLAGHRYDGGHMPTPKRITPRLTLTTTQGNAVQIGGLLGAAIRAWYAGREGPHGTRLPRPSAIGGPAIPPARPQPF